MNELALFSGPSGTILASILLGWRVVCAVEIDAYCREVLLRRQEEGYLDPFPIWDDVRTFDGKPWRGSVDIVSGGFPCQPFSVAGKRKGEDDERNMWPDTIRIIREVRPRYAFLENVPGLLTSGYFGTILRDIHESGYDCRWMVLGADDVGAPHRRKRLWILLADPEIPRSQGNEPARDTCAGGLSAERRCTWWDIDPADLPDSESDLRRASGDGRTDAPDGSGEADLSDTLSLNDDRGGHGASPIRRQRPRQTELSGSEGNSGWTAIARLGGMADEFPDRLDLIAAAFGGQTPRVATAIPYRVDRLKALGNAQVPLCAAEAWKILLSIDREQAQGRLPL